MKGIFQMPERGISFDLDNVIVDQFRIIGRRPSESGIMTEAYPIGEPIILITSNMPSDLRTQIQEIIGQYCNH